MSATEPTSRQLGEIEAGDQDSSFDMVNLIGYRKLAEYGSPRKNLQARTGSEAYAEYARIVLPIITKLGGSLVYRARCDHLFVGDETRDYDELIVIRYPSRKAYLEMFHSPEYQDAIQHRKAGLQFRVLHECTPV